MELADSRQLGFERLDEAAGEERDAVAVAFGIADGDTSTFEVEVFVNGESYGQGTGHSKQSAAKAAARQALNKLGLT